MKITEFLSSELFSLPIIQPPKQDFKQFIFRQLDSFNEKLTEINELQTHFDDVSNYPIERICNRQRHVSDKIKETLESYFAGKPSDAFINLSGGLVSRLKDFNDVLNVKTYFPNENFYRIRLHKENFPIEINSFFHIPFEKRGLVKTQRFSIPGFPSLYLGSSVYLCWEELNRPNINEFQAVRLKTIGRLNIIDLAPPPINSTNPNDFYNYLMIWPLVMACSVKVRNYEDTFKPEYIIPQLLLQWVRENGNIDGISYQTTHMNFKNALVEGEFINIVLPVKDNKSRGLCDHLKSKFEMTHATSIQLSQCANSGHNYIYTRNELEFLNKYAKNIEVIPGRITRYGDSILGELERNLNSLTTWPIGQQQEEITVD
jgi:hypothetical protein